MWTDRQTDRLMGPTHSLSYKLTYSVLFVCVLYIYICSYFGCNVVQWLIPPEIWACSQASCDRAARHKEEDVLQLRYSRLQKLLLLVCLSVCLSHLFGCLRYSDNVMETCYCFFCLTTVLLNTHPLWYSHKHIS